ncbi:targeting protein for Xklp2-like [Lutzomyia longipalpis]|uniref:TPX2 C-terminal domain-containing protein n=2 Tax=Lutzomyia longipalpis TaxID=7200 RepID=A0A1B0GKD0_LUTLO|nr:targeting protein for Xklp2-like [Lutzomyia longipalpis]
MPFDWDNIDCASPDLENSAYFFSVQHIEHEKDYENNIFVNKENAENVAKKPAKEANVDKNKKSLQIQENVKNQKIPLKTRINLQHVAPKNFSKVGKKLENCKAQEKNVVLKKEVKLAPRINVARNVRQVKNLPEQENKKTQKSFEFRAKPAPNFKLLHEKQKKIQKKQPPITVPQTPIVLRKSQVQNPKKRQIPEREKTKDFRNPMKVGRNVKVVAKEPFRPIKESKTTQVVPFNLQTTRRQEERRRFDDLSRQMRDLKIQKEMVEKKKQEDHLRRELRKKTEFRARPNPFK